MNTRNIVIVLVVIVLGLLVYSLVAGTRGTPPAPVPERTTDPATENNPQPLPQ